MEFSGIGAGFALFVIIYIGHWACIKGEYHCTKKIWVAFLIVGLVSIVASVFIEHTVVSSIFSILGFVSLWGIGEVIEQEKRVRKGWFPKKDNKTVKQ